MSQTPYRCVTCDLLFHGSGPCPKCRSPEKVVELAVIHHHAKGASQSTCGKPYKHATGELAAVTCKDCLSTVAPGHTEAVTVEHTEKEG